MARSTGPKRNALTLMLAFCTPRAHNGTCVPTCVLGRIPDGATVQTCLKFSPFKRICGKVNVLIRVLWEFSSSGLQPFNCSLVNVLSSDSASSGLMTIVKGTIFFRFIPCLFIVLTVSVVSTFCSSSGTLFSEESGSLVSLPSVHTLHCHSLTL